MGRETFKKRQKEAARWQKHQNKATRRMERRDEKARNERKLEEKNPRIAQMVSTSEPKKI